MTDRPRSLRQPQSLRQKVRGPNARPIAMLVVEGDRASARAQGLFGEFLDGRLAELRSVANAVLSQPADTARRQALSFIAADLRSSSITAGRPRLGAILASLEGAVRQNALDGEILKLHLDAVTLAIQPELAESDYQLLAADLGRAVKHRASA